MAAHANWPSLSSSVGKSGETQEIHRHVFQLLNSLPHCARSERFTVSCSMHNNWCVEARVYFRIVHCTSQCHPSLAQTETW